MIFGSCSGSCTHLEQSESSVQTKRRNRIAYCCENGIHPSVRNRVHCAKTVTVEIHETCHTYRPRCSICHTGNDVTSCFRSPTVVWVFSKYVCATNTRPICNVSTVLESLFSWIWPLHIISDFSSLTVKIAPKDETCPNAKVPLSISRIAPIIRGQQS